ncbi:MAG: hypothetical protein GX856_05855 [Gammaproteobacteria bacterium]|nr:hypothetical protein [Gammaproteobacteria bacterium]
MGRHGQSVHASPRRWLREAALAALALLAVLAAARIHYAGQTLARGPDQADILLASFNEASHAIAEEGLLAAMYSERVRAGEPNWSNPNHHVLYPLYFNWAGADASPEATLDRLNAIILLHLALLAAGTFLLARALGAPAWPALLVAFAIPWFPAVRAVAGWPHIIAATAWLPWVLAAQVRLYRDAGWRRQAPMALLLALAATLLVHAHPAQTLVFAAWASGGMLVLLAVQAAADRDRAGLRRLAASAGWLAFAAAITLVACWPYLSGILAFHAGSIRWLGEVGGHVVGNQPLPLEALLHHALPASDAGLLLRFEYRRGVGNAYLGGAVLVAALCVLSRHLPGTAATRCARALLGCGLLAAASCFKPMAPLLAALPLVGRVRELVWWSAPAVVMLLPVAALGLHAARGRTLPARMRDPLAWLAAATFALALASTLAGDAAYRAEAVLALLAAFAALAWCLRARTGGATALAVACGLLFFATAWTPWRHNMRFQLHDAMLHHADRVQARADASALAARLDGLDVYRFVVGPGLGNRQALTHSWTLHGFRSIHGGIGPIAFDKHRLLSAPTPAVSALYGVRWSLWPEEHAAPGDEALRPGLFLRTHPEALPRLFLASGVDVVDSPVDALLGATAVPRRAFARREDLPPGVDAGSGAGPADAGGEVHLRRNDRTLLEATVEVDGPAVLVLNEDPGARWRATLDGRAVPVFRVNGYQAALALPARGRHEVRIERPARPFGRPGRTPGP